MEWLYIRGHLNIFLYKDFKTYFNIISFFNPFFKFSTYLVKICRKWCILKVKNTYFLWVFIDIFRQKLVVKRSCHLFGDVAPFGLKLFWLYLFPFSDVSQLNIHLKGVDEIFQLSQILFSVETFIFIPICCKKRPTLPCSKAKNCKIYHSAHYELKLWCLKLIWGPEKRFIYGLIDFI